MFNGKKYTMYFTFENLIKSITMNTFLGSLPRSWRGLMEWRMSVFMQVGGKGQERLLDRGVSGKIDLPETQETSRLRKRVQWWESKKLQLLSLTDECK